MYPLPPELSEKIHAFLTSQGLDDDMQRTMHDWMATLLVRENRRLRRQICVLWRNLSEVADSDEADYGDVRSAAGGEFTCEYIVNEILKPNVYFNSEEAAERKQAVEDFIDSFYEDDALPG